MTLGAPMRALKREQGGEWRREYHPGSTILGIFARPAGLRLTQWKGSADNKKRICRNVWNAVFRFSPEPQGTYRDLSCDPRCSLAMLNGDYTL